MSQVLIVEDDVAIRTLICTVLEDAGYEALEVPDGHAALEHLRTHPHGLVVLLDKLMPGMDGQAVLEAVHVDPALARRHQFILISATARQISPRLAELLAALSADVLAKPFDVDTLLAVVAKAEQKLQPMIGSSSRPI
jgi:two-component system phosphate regulon response regulator PhoB